MDNFSLSGFFSGKSLQNESSINFAKTMNELDLTKFTTDYSGLLLLQTKLELVEKISIVKFASIYREENIPESFQRIEKEFESVLALLQLLSKKDIATLYVEFYFAHALQFQVYILPFYFPTLLLRYTFLTVLF